jgi:hypothetical protein
MVSSGAVSLMYGGKMKLILPTELADAIQPRLPDM